MPRIGTLSLISNGMLREAAETAENNVIILSMITGEGIPVIACEPSCILTIKDDYPALVMDVLVDDNYRV